jgi:hypothetical protein
MVPSRLENNRRLRNSLNLLRSTMYTSHNGGAWVRQLTLPFDGSTLLRLSEMMVRGLAFHHWSMIFQPTDIVRATLLTRHGRRFVDPLFASNAKRRLVNVIGGGALAYQAVDSVDMERTTIWKLSLYGAEFRGHEDRGEAESTIYILTAASDAEKAVQFIESITADARR